MLLTANQRGDLHTTDGLCVQPAEAKRAAMPHNARLQPSVRNCSPLCATATFAACRALARWAFALPAKTA